MAQPERDIPRSRPPRRPTGERIRPGPPPTADRGATGPGPGLGVLLAVLSGLGVGVIKLITLLVAGVLPGVAGRMGWSCLTTPRCVLLGVGDGGGALGTVVGSAAWLLGGLYLVVATGVVGAFVYGLVVWLAPRRPASWRAAVAVPLGLALLAADMAAVGWLGP